MILFRHFRGSTLVCSLIVGLVILGRFDSLRAQETAAANSTIDFNATIRPLLSDNCFFCHGPDAENRQSDLRLDVREDAINYGAIDTSDPLGSLLWERIMSDDPDLVMPPPESHKTLTADQKETLQTWLEEGAMYQEHWAYDRLTRPSLPELNADEETHPIDRFVRKKLESHGVSAAPQAPTWLLVRRYFLDLIGLPPTPEQMEKWTKVCSQEGFEPLVDHLLNSKHFGERMAVGWLDVARFSDTVGYHGDQNQNVFPYRDYVIESFNQNKPFDQFTIEQLAGDLIENPTEESLIATGFNRLNMMTREGGAQPGEYIAKYTADRVRTVGMAWMGATIGCAECHDHKYDPFTARDFYSLGAFFSDLTQWGVYSDYSYTPNKDLRGFTNDYPFPPELTISSKSLLKHQRRIASDLRAFYLDRLQKDPSSLEDLAEFADNVQRFDEQNVGLWRSLAFEEGEANARTLQSTVLGGVEATWVDPNDANNQEASSSVYRFAGYTGPLARVQLHFGIDRESKSIALKNSKVGIAQVELSIRGPDGNSNKLPSYRIEASEALPIYNSGRPKLGVDAGWKTDTTIRSREQTLTFWVNQPAVVNAESMLEITVNGFAPAHIECSISPIATLAAPDRDQTASRSVATDAEQQTVALLHGVVNGDVAFEGELGGQVALLYWLSRRFNDRNDPLRELVKDYRECRDGLTWSLISQPREPTPSRILPRGDWQDESGEVVEPAVPEFLPQLLQVDDRRLTRLDLAHWITHPENPLTARVFVNRIWAQFFGTGLSSTTDDLGTQGDPVSHPDLLNWLAVEFIESGWDVKHLVRLVVTSETYRQSSRYRKEMRESDPDNRLLASQNARRLEAEFVRDHALAAAGLLESSFVGGPSCFPYQPPDYYANLQFPNRRYQHDRNYAQYRRGLYMHWQRTFLHPMLANFDAPSREECIAKRNVSNTPQQALTLLNDPSFVEAAKVFAIRILNHSGDRKAKLDYAYQLALGRPATSEEGNALSNFIDDQLREFSRDPETARRALSVGLAPLPESADPVVLAAWMSTARVILNLNESITRF